MLDAAHRWTMEVACPQCGEPIEVRIVNETGPAYYHGPRVEVEDLQDCACGCSYTRIEQAAYDRLLD